MQVPIKYTWILSKVRGLEEEVVELEEGSTGEDLIHLLVKKEEKFFTLLLNREGIHPSLHLYQRGELLPLSHPLTGEEVTLLLALAGG